MSEPLLISKAFQTFMNDAPQQAQAWGIVRRNYQRNFCWLACGGIWSAPGFAGGTRGV